MANEESGIRKSTLQTVLQEVARIYTMAREDGIVSIRFLNAKRGKKDIKEDDVEKFLSGVTYYGVTRIGGELDKKIFKRFVFKEEMKKPVLVMIVTDGNVWMKTLKSHFHVFRLTIGLYRSKERDLMYLRIIF